MASARLLNRAGQPSVELPRRSSALPSRGHSRSPGLGGHQRIDVLVRPVQTVAALFRRRPLVVDRNLVLDPRLIRFRVLCELKGIVVVTRDET